MIRAGILVFLFLATPALAAGPVNSLSWKVTEGKGIFGYLVYRSEQRQGPFLRASKQIIRRDKSTSSADTSAQYRFVDHDVVAGRTYYYFIDVVAVSGRKQRLSGVQSRTVKSE